MSQTKPINTPQQLHRAIAESMTADLKRQPAWQRKINQGVANVHRQQAQRKQATW